jgi:ribonucleotide reductase alpha subunit
MPVIHEIFYTDKECTEKNKTVSEAIAAYKRVRVANSHPVRMDEKMLMNQLPLDLPITTLQMNGLVAQAMNIRGIPNHYDLKPLIEMTPTTNLEWNKLRDTVVKNGGVQNATLQADLREFGHSSTVSSGVSSGIHPVR